MNTLIVMTFLAGSVWGPQVTVTPMPSSQACVAAQKTTADGLSKMGKTNLTGGGVVQENDGKDIVLVTNNGREMARIVCQSK